MEEDNEVICPVCQKFNFKHENGYVCCSNCNIKIKTTKKLSDIKNSIAICLDSHANKCTHEPQFTVIPDLHDFHIYLICETCTEINGLI